MAPRVVPSPIRVAPPNGVLVGVGIGLGVDVGLDVGGGVAVGVTVVAKERV